MTRGEILLSACALAGTPGRPYLYGLGVAGPEGVRRVVNILQTEFRRGKIRLTKPAFIAFCYDVVDSGRPHPKIFIKAMLYSTGRRGQVI